MEPIRAVEVERKYDVDDDTPLPDWSELPGVASAGAAEVRELDARYVDTADRSLARRGIAVRRRSGGPDEGWHVKSAAIEGRHEWHWPLDDGDAEHIRVPDDVASALAEWASPPFAPIARIRNRRTAYALRNAAGGVVAEFVDDRVTATDEGTGVERSWREWEVELGPAAPAGASERAALFDAVDRTVRAAGARDAASASKLARTLGL